MLSQAAFYKGFKRTLVMVFPVVLVSGCLDPEEYPKTQRGAAVGATIGAVAGALSGGNAQDRQNAILGGAALGALLGGGVGLYLDAEDKRRQRDAAVKAVQQNRRVPWKNPNTGVGGTITPIVGTSGPGCGTFEFSYGRHGQIQERGNFEACKDYDGNVTFR